MDDANIKGFTASQEALIEFFACRGACVQLEGEKKPVSASLRRALESVPLFRQKMTRETQELKDKGNQYFKNGEYREAVDCYTQALAVRQILEVHIYNKYSIQKGSSDRAILFTNRANARLKLQDWEGVVNDAHAAINIHGAKHKNSIKAYYYLAQAQLKMHHPHDALATGRIAYRIAYEHEDPNISVIADSILQAKREKWAGLEKERIWAANDTLRKFEAMAEKQKVIELEDVTQQFSDGTLGYVGREEEQARIEAEYAERVSILREQFAKETPEAKERVVPEYLVDNITFAIMQDPVMTRTGRSYERASLIEHLGRSSTDPITREPVRRDELVANINLREACEDFSSKNPWAVDW